MADLAGWTRDTGNRVLLSLRATAKTARLSLLVLMNSTSNQCRFFSNQKQMLLFRKQTRKTKH